MKDKKTLFITGGTGFIGQHLVTFFIEQGHQIILPVRNKNKVPHAFLEKNTHICYAHLEDKVYIKEIFQKFSPDVIMHLAWEGMDRQSRNTEQQMKNIVIMQNLVEEAGECGCSTFIGLGSQAEYGIYNQRINERFPAQPQNLYGCMKLACGLLGKIYAQKYHLRYAWLRLFSTFGPHDTGDYIIPYTIKALVKNQSPQLTSCEQKWDYLYVKDIPPLISKILSKDEHFCDIYNFCSGQARVLKDIVRLIKDQMVTEGEPCFGALTQRPDGLNFLEGENKKFQETFGWKPLTDLSLALKETIVSMQ